MKKVLLVATMQSHIAQFHKPLIKLLQSKDCMVDVAAFDNLSLKKNLTLTEPNNIYNIPFSRSPYNVRNIKAYKELKKLLESGNYDIVHCNTPVGGILTRLAARKLRKENKIKVVYEAHGFHFFRGGSLINWLLWYPIEKVFSFLTDCLIVINNMDYDLARKKFKAKQVCYIHGAGVDLSRFKDKESYNDLREEYKLSSNSRIVLSVGELNKNKNHKIIIKALSVLKDKNIHFFIAGNGPLKSKLEKLAVKLKVEKQVHFLGYRRDLKSIYKSADVFVLPSKREGLGLAAIEAMSFGLPIITSNKHGINDYSNNDISGYKYNPNDYKGFAQGIKTIIYDEEKKKIMGNNNILEAQKYTIGESINELEKIYCPLLES